MQDEGCKGGPGVVVLDERGGLLGIHQTWWELNLGALRDGVVLADDPQMLLQLFPG